MSKLETTITELERQLALKKAYQAAKITTPKGTPEDVAIEVQAKLREVAESLALSQEKHAEASESSIFSPEQVEALQMLADATIARSKGGTPPPAGTVPGSAPTEKKGPTDGGSSTHVPRSGGSPRKAKIVIATNVRGESKRYANPDDEVYLPSPDKVDEHGMIHATHMKRGVTFKIPLDDIEFLD